MLLFSDEAKESQLSRRALEGKTYVQSVEGVAKEGHSEEGSCSNRFVGNLEYN